MFLQLGSYKFNGVKLPQSWSNISEANYEQVPIISKKPVLQKTGDQLEEIDLGILLSAEYCVPDDELTSLKTMISTGEVSSLIDGNGKNYGKFVITSVDNSIVMAMNNGTPSLISLTLKLLEYNSNSTVTENTGEAVSSNNPVTQTAVSPKQGTGLLINANMKAGTSAVSKISSSVSSSPTKGMYSKISGLATSAKTYFTTVNSQINATKKIVYRATNLVTSITSLNSALDTLKNAADIKNGTDLLSANEEVGSAMYKVKNYYAKVAAFIGSREGGE